MSELVLLGGLASSLGSRSEVLGSGLANSTSRCLGGSKQARQGNCQLEDLHDEGSSNERR